ncbi:class I SAM-dependent methyltransferase [Pseudidiomarina sediminum]|uniref:Class I SAM-dependent methyltransferase n=1 Tax=Pseudidiomarina sediminum TaxID=431675 RepID=A0A432Z8G2_9GAMM|nr:class I SAM-dependent methyltransferase [Pseudidiomarina sediminum]MBY6063320.1 class I SAM-dependent methyltransferase [Pseudidiomarina sediminum]RUO74168.1 class I SAM-dependent methyltransferase [Pseudidiomarina sediminum]
MNEHDQYMQDFFEIFGAVERWGPGSEADTLHALGLLPTPPQHLLELGCGKGVATLTLARATQAQITAVDNEPSALAKLTESVQQHDLAKRILALDMDMQALNLADASFDTLWCEASIYVMGVTQALTAWRRLLKPEGYLVFNDLVWLTDEPSQAAVAFWQQNYPDMAPLATRLAQVEQAGYQVIATFPLSEQGWHDYYAPLKARSAELAATRPSSQAVKDIAKEITIYERHLGEFGYQFFILRRKD